MPAQPSYITLNRHRTYYFRIVVPKPVRTALGLQREIRRSLKTDSLRLALRRARQYAARIEAVFDKVLGVVDQDDYDLTDEDYESLTKELNQASHGGLWGSHSTDPAEAAPVHKSALTDEEWRQSEEKQRRSDIAQKLTGHSKRDVPESQQELAEQLYAAGLNLPRREFLRLLPQLIDRLVLNRLAGSVQATPGTTPSRMQTASSSNGPTIFELWELLRESDIRLNKKKSVSAHNDEHGHACRLSILSGNKPFSSLSLEAINQLYLQSSQVKTVRGAKIPPPHSPIDSILAKPGEERLSSATVEKMIIRLDVLHKFAYRKGFTTVDPAKTEKPYLSKRQPRATRSADEGESFLPADLEAIFSGYIYAGSATGTTDLVFPYHFWLPLFGLFTGGRLNEICQLDLEDICQEEGTGVWFIRIADDPDDKPHPKSLKNESSHRLLPIHDELIRVGFLDFVEQARSDGRVKLFSDGLTYNPSKGWGGNATTFFTRMPSPSTRQGGYFFNIGIRKRLSSGKPDNKTFHSFRHTFIGLLRNTGGDALSLLETFTGHAKRNKTQADDYGLGIYLKTKYVALHSVQFPVDLSGITYADFKERHGQKLEDSVAAHRKKHGMNQAE